MSTINRKIFPQNSASFSSGKAGAIFQKEYACLAQIDFWLSRILLRPPVDPSRSIPSASQEGVDSPLQHFEPFRAFGSEKDGSRMVDALCAKDLAQHAKPCISLPKADTLMNFKPTYAGVLNEPK